MPAVEIIRGRHLAYIIYTIDKLYWMSGSKPPASQDDAYYFNVDNVNYPPVKSVCIGFNV